MCGPTGGYGDTAAEAMIEAAVPGITADVTAGTTDSSTYWNFSADLTSGSVTYNYSWTFNA